MRPLCRPEEALILILLLKNRDSENRPWASVPNRGEDGHPNSDFRDHMLKGLCPRQCAYLLLWVWPVIPVLWFLVLCQRSRDESPQKDSLDCLSEWLPSP